MPTTTAAVFTGFSPGAIQFLHDLAEHNDRAWFQPRKEEYERLLKAPLEALCVAMQEQFEARQLPLSADPGRSPFRIYRDVRFSKDKSPYKTNVAAAFRWVGEGTEMSHAEGDPGGYFHLAPGEAFVGGGMWHPPTTKLASFRRIVADDPARVRSLLDDPAFSRMFGDLGGERLKRVPTGFSADHPEAELLKFKDMTFGHRLSDADVFSARLPNVLADAFEVAVPVMRFLARLG